MAIAIFVKHPETGEHYQRSVWYKDSRKDDAEKALASYQEISKDVDFQLDPILVFSDKHEGE